MRRRIAAVLNANAARSGGDRALQILRDAHRDMAGLDAQAPCRSPFSSSQWTLATNGGKRQSAWAYLEKMDTNLGGFIFV